MAAGCGAGRRFQVSAVVLATREAAATSAAAQIADGSNAARTAAAASGHALRPWSSEPLPTSPRGRLRASEMPMAGMFHRSGPVPVGAPALFSSGGPRPVTFANAAGWQLGVPSRARAAVARGPRAQAERRVRAHCGYCQAPAGRTGATLLCCVACCVELCVVLCCVLCGVRVLSYLSWLRCALRCCVVLRVVLCCVACCVVLRVVWRACFKLLVVVALCATLLCCVACCVVLRVVLCCVACCVACVF
jgi:hypothetical protein